MPRCVANAAVATPHCRSLTALRHIGSCKWLIFISCLRGTDLAISCGTESGLDPGRYQETTA